MGRYSKLIGALVGNIVAILLAWAAVTFPGLAECVATPEVDVCSVLGFDQVQVTAALMAIVNMAFVYQFPPNTPNPKTGK